MGLFSKLIDDSEWCGNIRNQLDLSELKQICFTSTFSSSMVPNQNKQDSIQYMSQALDTAKKLPRPKSVEANKIRKDLLAGVEGDEEVS